MSSSQQQPPAAAKTHSSPSPPPPPPPYYYGNNTSMALPLLEGLLGAPGEPAQILHQALKRERAWQTLERFLRPWVRANHGRKQQQPQSEQQHRHKRLKRTLSPPFMMGTLDHNNDGVVVVDDWSSMELLPLCTTVSTLDHWWWKSLVSYVDAERSAAARMLFQANADAPQHDLLFWSARPWLIVLEGLVQRITTTTTTNDTRTIAATIPVSRRLIGELVSLLDHFWNPSMVVLAQVRWNVLQRVTQSVMELSLRLYDEDHHPEPCGVWTTLAAHDLLLGLLGLLQKWLLEYNPDDKTSSTYRQLHIWSSKPSHGSSWSPLAALLTAHAATQAAAHWLTCSASKSSNSNSSGEPSLTSSAASPQHLALSCLQLLVDPESRRRPHRGTPKSNSAPAPPKPTNLQHQHPTTSTAASALAAATSTTRGMSLSSVLERATTQPSTHSSPSSQALPPPRLSEDEDEEEDDDEDAEDNDEDLIMEEADEHDDQGVTGHVQDEGEKDINAETIQVESEEEPVAGERDEDECDEEELFIASGQGDAEIEEEDDHDEGEQLVNGSSDDDDDDDEDDDEDDLENDIDFHHPLLASSGGEARNRARSLSPTNGTGEVSNSNSTGRNAVSDVASNADSPDPVPMHPALPQRQEAFVQAAMQSMARHYALSSSHKKHGLLTVEAEDYLLQGVNRVIKPPKKPITTKIIMRRAPTQEEFFRGNLSCNPISMDSLAADPTVGDLRQHIANDLQMADSAELIEILIANKIVDINLKLRVVHQVLWRRHLMENTTTSSSASGAGHSFLSMGSGFSMIFSHGVRSAGGGASTGITADTPAAHLPPMIAMYRLAGVDGEATEDTVTELADPEAAVEAATAEEREILLEKEYGLTRIFLDHKGVQILLRSIQRNIANTLRQIRRDDVQADDASTVENMARANFRTSSPCQGLILMRHCTRLAVNRKKLLQARAPTVLLTLLLDVLKGLEEPDSSKMNDSSKSNPTADTLQELIECLTSDITEVGTGFEASDGVQDASSMPLLLESIETTSLGAPLRNVIAKLLPFLTYGQADLSQSLAQRFERHIVLSRLSEKENYGEEKILMNTFVETAMSLPANEVCNALRSELIRCGFVNSLCSFIMKDMPEEPPAWSAALWPKGENPSKTYEAWRMYISRDGVRTAFRILVGLCKQHHPTLAAISSHCRFVESSHWLEATSDNTDLMIDMNGLGLSAEMLLDELADGAADVKKGVEAARKKTRMRKKELAEERRNKTLGKIVSFGPSMATEEPSFSGVTSLLGPMLGFFNAPNASSPPSGKGKASAKSDGKKPTWLAEMEMIEEESGLTCAICQEGLKSAASELLGLYAFVRKVAIPLEQCGSRASIDGSSLLKSLPSTAPASLSGKRVGEEWFPLGRAAGEDLTPTTSICMSSGSRRSSIFTTTVSAGNGIHVSCHARARQADRSHPKAPKSEWEGAKLRNGRVDCNIILPLVSSRSSKVSLIAVDSSLSEHQTAVSNLIGVTPKSMLWNFLFDMRFLLLRMTHGEPLNSDCGGGSLASNCQLLLYEMQTADMFEKNAQVDQPEQSQHARGLSAGFLAACSIFVNGDFSGCDQTSLIRGIADAAPMACLTCILFHNCSDDSGSASEVSEDKAHPNRRWVAGRDYFFKGLLLCAGRRRALGIDNSGCLPNRGNKKRLRPSSFADWEGETEDKEQTRLPPKPCLADFQHSLRPMLTFFALMDQLSAVFASSLEDDLIGDCAETLVRTVEDCLSCKNIDELLLRTKTTLEPEEIVELVQRGMGNTHEK